MYQGTHSNGKVNCALLFFFIISGCAALSSHDNGPASHTLTPVSLLSEKYLKAVFDAADPQPDEIYPYLTPVSPSNAALREKIIQNETYILAVSWVTDTKYYKVKAQNGRLVLESSILTSGSKATVIRSKKAVDQKAPEEHFGVIGEGKLAFVKMEEYGTTLAKLSLYKKLLAGKSVGQALLEACK